jgi:hypothetical protein
MRGMGIETRRDTHRRDSVGLNIIPGALERERLGEADKAHLCRAIVGLTEVTYEGETTAKPDNANSQILPNSPAALAVLTIRPNFCLRKIGQAAWVQENAPLRCTSWTWSHSLSDMFLNLIAIHDQMRRRFSER